MPRYTHADYTLYGHDRRLDLEMFNSLTEFIRTVIVRRDVDHSINNSTRKHKFFPHPSALGLDFQSADCVPDDFSADAYIDNMTAGDVRQGMLGGLSDLSIISKAERYVRSIDTDTIEKLCQRKRSVAGGSVNIPRYLQGNPLCRTKYKRASRDSKVVGLNINTEAAGPAIGSPTALKAGELVARLIVSMEKAGYRMNLYCSSAYAVRSNRVLGLLINLKRPDEAMNYRKVLWPFTTQTFEVMCAYGWIGTSPYWNTNDIGYLSVKNFNYDEALEAETYCKAAGENFHSIRMQTLIGLIHDHGMDRAYKILQAQILG